MKLGSKHSSETKEKMIASAAVRISPPLTKEHKNRLRESNLKTWSNPELKKNHGERMKKALSLMSPEKKTLWRNKVLKYCRSPENIERARKIMVELRKNPEFIKKANRNKKGRVGSFKGRKHTIESRIKNSISKKKSPLTTRGKNNPAYIDGNGEKRRGERAMFQQTLEYRLFREAVFRRDNFTCVLCNIKGGRLCVDHIKSYKHYPNLRTDVNNGRTLCLKCHTKTPNFGRKEEYAKRII